MFYAKRRGFLTVLLALVPGFACLHAAAATDCTVQMVKDINTNPAGSDAENMTPVGDAVFFTANDGTHGRELWWARPGTGETRLLKDITPGPDSTSISYLTAAQDRVYFLVGQPDYAADLWISDGTMSGTRMVTPVPWPFYSSLFPMAMTSLSRTLFIAVANINFETFQTSLELWRSDGTLAGTYQVKVLDTRPDYEYLSADLDMVSTSTKTFIMAKTSTYSINGAWVTDGTSTGTTFRPPISQPQVLGNDLFYFLLGVFGIESGLWKTNGTDEGTMLVKSFATSYKPILWQKVVGQNYYFTRASSSYFLPESTEFWKSDGTTEGTTKLNTFHAKALTDNVSVLECVQTGNRLIYAAFDGNVISSMEPIRLSIFSTDFSGGDTVELWSKEYYSNYMTDSFLEFFFNSLTQTQNKAFFFSLSDSHDQLALWSTDGTSAGTTNIASVPVSSYLNNTFLSWEALGIGSYLVANQLDETAGREFLISDGTTRGTRTLADLRPGSDDANDIKPGLESYFPMAAVNGHALFQITDSGANLGVWATNSTSSGAIRIKAIRPAYLPPEFPVLGQYAYFADSGTSIYQTDGTISGTEALNIPSSLRFIDVVIAAGNMLFFTANDGVFYRYDLNTTEIIKLNEYSAEFNFRKGSYCALGNRLVFSANVGTSTGEELWVSDGSISGTVLLKDINTGQSSSYPDNLTVMGGLVYFTADDDAHGRELWRTDGTGASTVMVRDIVPDTYMSSSPEGLTVLGNTLYFSAYDGAHGRELWRSDGTEAGTLMVADIVPGANGSSPSQLAAYNGMLYFQADDGVHGKELWRTDGTAQGTALFADIRPGAGSGQPQEMTVSGGMLYFAADDLTAGRSLWMTDGVPAHTWRIRDIWPGPNGAPISQLQDVGGKLYFLADDGVHGNELWTAFVDPSADSDQNGILDGIEGYGDTDGDGRLDYEDPDNDNDGLSDAVEGAADIDGDGKPNYTDTDSDGDGMSDSTEHQWGSNPYDAADIAQLPLRAWPLAVVLLIASACMLARRNLIAMPRKYRGKVI